MDFERFQRRAKQYQQLAQFLPLVPTSLTRLHGLYINHQYQSSTRTVEFLLLTDITIWKDNISEIIYFWSDTGLPDQGWLVVPWYLGTALNHEFCKNSSLRIFHCREACTDGASMYQQLPAFHSRNELANEAFTVLSSSHCGFPSTSSYRYVPAWWKEVFVVRLSGWSSRSSGLIGFIDAMRQYSYPNVFFLHFFLYLRVFILWRRKLYPWGEKLSINSYASITHSFWKMARSGYSHQISFTCLSVPLP